MVNYIFNKKLDKKFVEEELNFNFEEDYKGEGIYEIFVGSRGLVEEVKKVSDGNEFEFKSKDELLSEIDCDEEEMGYYEEFISSEEEDYSSLGKVWVYGMSEEECVVFVWVGE